MNSNKNKELKSIIRDKFRNFSIETDELNWSNIEKHLRKKPLPIYRRPIAYYIFGIAATFLLVILFSFFNYNEKVSNPIITENFKSPKELKNTNPTKSEFYKQNEIKDRNSETDTYNNSEHLSNISSSENENNHPSDIHVEDTIKLGTRILDSATLQMEPTYLTDSIAKLATLKSVDNQNLNISFQSENHLSTLGVGKIRQVFALKNISIHLKPFFNYHTITPIKNDLIFVQDANLPPRFDLQRLGFSGSFSIDFHITQQYSLYTGLAYTQWNYSYQYIFEDFFAQSINSSTIKKEAKSIGLHIGLSRVMNFQTQANHYLNGDFEFQHNFSSLSPDRVSSLVLNLGYEIEYDLGSNNLFSLQPTYSYKFGESTFTDLRTHSYWFGLQISFSRKLGR